MTREPRNLRLLTSIGGTRVAGKPLMVDAIIGNSHLLATLDGRGEMHQFFWPNIDSGQHLGVFLTGVHVQGRTARASWFSQEGWLHEQAYLPDSNVIRTSASSLSLGLTVECLDFALPERSAVVRWHSLVNTTSAPLPVLFSLYAALDLDGSNLLNTVYYDAGLDALVFYRRGIYVVVGAGWPIYAYQCGRENTPGSSRWSVEENRLSGHAIEMGDVDGAFLIQLGALAPGGKASVPLYITAGISAEAALSQLTYARREGPERLLAETNTFWSSWLKRGREVRTGEADADELYRRSLLVMKLLADAGNGGIIAAPETDPCFLGSGGYGYCWGRDAAWITTAFDEAGYHDEAVAFYRWAVRTQEPSGVWYQRYFTNGTLAPSWGLLQIDETASILYGMWHHYGLVNDPAFLREVWPAVHNAAAFLAGFLDSETGLPKASVDLWEERTEESAYSSAAVYGGLLAAAQIATAIGDNARAARWREAAARVKLGIENVLWYPPDDRFLRGVRRHINPGEYHHRKSHGDGVSQMVDGRTEVFVEDMDRGLDISLLGVSIPFGVIPSMDARVRSTAAQIARYLENERIGGIHRYSGDHYRGGNPWVLCTLWLGLYELSAGDRHRAYQRLRWAVEHRTRLGLLPEQVDRDTGHPAWIVPLNWSHAMYVHTVLALTRYGVIGEKASSHALSELVRSRR